MHLIGTSVIGRGVNTPLLQALITSALEEHSVLHGLILLSCLSGQTHGRIGSTKQIIIAPLENFEEETIFEHICVNMEKFAAGMAIIENFQLTHFLQRASGQIIARLNVVIIIIRNVQKLDAAGSGAFDETKQIMGGKRNLLNTATT